LHNLPPDPTGTNTENHHGVSCFALGGVSWHSNFLAAIATWWCHVWGEVRERLPTPWLHLLTGKQGELFFKKDSTEIKTNPFLGFDF
jgi:hypothetical protein